MKDISKNELKEMAKGYFKSEGVDTLFATSDGQFFLKEGFQKNHAGDKLAKYKFILVDGDILDFEEKKDEVKTVEVKTETPAKPVPIPELIKLLLGIDDVESLKQIRDGESGGLNRKGAIAAVDARIHEIQFGAELAEIADKTKLDEMLLKAHADKRKADVKLIEARIIQLTEKES